MNRLTTNHTKYLFHSLWIIPIIAWSALFLASIGSNQSFQNYLIMNPQLIILMSPTYIMLIWLFIFRSIKEHGTFLEYKRVVLWLSISQLIMGNFITAILGFLSWKKAEDTIVFKNRYEQKGINSAIIVLVALSVFSLIILRRLRFG